jgi:hypothetical protein
MQYYEKYKGEEDMNLLLLLINTSKNSTGIHSTINCSLGFALIMGLISWHWSELVKDGGRYQNWF